MEKQKLINWDEKKKIGDSALIIVEQWCKYTHRTFNKAILEEDKRFGLDAYIDAVPTDIKRVSNGMVFVGNIRIDNEPIFISRHPFKKETKAINYIFTYFRNTDIINSKEEAESKILYHGGVIEYNLQHFFNSITDLEKFYKNVQNLDRVKMSDLKSASKEQFALMCKHELLSGVNLKNKNLNYKKDTMDEWSYRLEKTL